MTVRHCKHIFPPVIDSNSKVLILGSVPSVKSIEAEFYYMHPQNRFWKVLSNLLGIDLKALSSNEKAEVLLKNKIALYDAIEECDIEGSSDAKIRAEIPSDIPTLIADTGVKRIFCNGNASYKYLIKYHPELEEMTTLLPSTSPANARFSLEMLLNEWKIIFNWVLDKKV